MVGRGEVSEELAKGGGGSLGDAGCGFAILAHAWKTLNATEWGQTNRSDLIRIWGFFLKWTRFLCAIESEFPVK